MSTDPTKASPYAPLTRFYEQENLAPLSFVEMEGEDLPQPQRHLLVHNRDMTTRLERYHRSPISLRALYISRDTNNYFREVLLINENSGKPVEYGAIEIYLDVFPLEMKEKILKGEQPLGGILVEQQFPFVSSPKSYFKVKADKHIKKQLELQKSVNLYGRANLLCTEDGRPLANIVEILPDA
jgi:chorismate-pyruvate lyase